MNLSYNLRLLLLFSIALSLISLAGPLSSDFHLPELRLAYGNSEFPGPPPCPAHTVGGVCSWFWLPAGPEMDTLLTPIFTDATAEYTALQSSPSPIDFADSPCSPSVCQTLLNSPNFLVTAALPQVGYYEIQFHLANNFWGCNFNFGNAACGIQIRQGIAHMIDKAPFTNKEPDIAGISVPIDNPVPPNSGGLLSPNPCGYDASFSENGTQCAVGASGGTAYHLHAATGASGFPWLYAPGSPDLNAAAQHFVNAGIATGFNPSTSVLTGISPAAANNAVYFFVRNDDSVRLDLGNSLWEQICYLFTGAYATSCQYLFRSSGPLTAFWGFTTSPTSVNLNWGMYTAAYSYVPFFDNSLYYSYNSRFVSGVPSIQPPDGPCSAQALPTASAADYMYLCSPNYDSLSSRMETAPCLQASGDPIKGAASNLPTPPGNGLCSGSSQLSALTAGIQAEAYFGANVFTLPVFERSVQFGFLNDGWIRDINSNDEGLPNHFTWLNAYNPAPPALGTIRQGFSWTTRSVSLFIAETEQDRYVVNSVYDSLYQPNPLSPELINWMTISTFQKDNASLGYPSGVQAPAHTLTSYRFTLRGDLYFQDGRPVTSYDVAFSYLSLAGSGAFLSTGEAPVTGITVLSLHQFDIAVNSLGPFVLPNLTTLPTVPARYWTSAGSAAWDSAATTCNSSPGCSISQYTLSGSTVNCKVNCSPFSASLMTVNPADVVATFDPISAHVFVGSGPFQCGTVTSSGSGVCSSTGGQNPPVGGSYAMTRFGKGLAPASSVSDLFFRSSGNAALWIWSEQNDLNPSTIFGLVAACYLKPVDLTGTCAHFQQGIGGFNGLGGTPAPVNAAQVSVENRFYALNWIAPFNWQTNPPLGISPFPPVLYEGSSTLNPSTIAGCLSNTGYDC